MEYKEFIESKIHLESSDGFKTLYYNDNLFDYQKFIVDKALSRGRCAVFLDTGLGKTLIQLTIAYNIVKKTNKNVLILTPLAVARQFVKEAEKFGINEVTQSKGGSINSKITVANYQRLDKFDSKSFECLILDESSILKNFDGKTKDHVTNFMKKLPYRFLFTATPSPNDYIELGTSSEALGYLGYIDMLGKYFSNKENNFKPQDIGSKFYLKPHAKNDFFLWVSSWSISARKPSDLGFSDENFILPKLNTHKYIVKNDSNQVFNDQVLLFNRIARSMSEVRAEEKATFKIRCEKAVDISKSLTSVYWCNYNHESHLLKELDSDAVELIGSMSLDKKEDILSNFSDGNIKRLITKAKITSFGLNWQHCNNTVFFPTWSYEQYYQAIRRFWRFGQTKPVDVHIVASDGMSRVIDSLDYKARKASDMFENLKNSTLSAKNDMRKLSDIQLPNWSK